MNLATAADLPHGFHVSPESNLLGCFIMLRDMAAMFDSQDVANGHHLIDRMVVQCRVVISQLVDVVALKRAGCFLVGGRAGDA